MEWYIQLSLYIFAMVVAFIALWQVDFNKFIRVGRKEFAILVYAVLSLALGYLIGKLLIEVGELLQTAL